MSDVFDLDRDTNIKNNIDATGKKWIIEKDRTNHLLYARPEGGRADSVIPEVLAGAWTKSMLLNDQIKMHVKASWDKADAQRIKNERRNQAEKEHGDEKAQSRQEAETNHDKELTGGSDDTRSEEESKEEASQEEAVTASFEGMPYDQLLLLAKEQGIKARKKAEIIEALTNGTEND